MANENRTRKESTKTLRTRAERLLVSTPREVAELPVDDVQKLVHELQVHQIELEMQNDELRRTQSELEAARERLRLPYDAAPVGFLTLDAAGVIREANLAAARLLNFDRLKLAGQKLTRFIAPESQDVFYLRHRQLFGSGEKQICELHLLPTDRTQMIARVEAVVERAGEDLPTRCLLMLSDITEQKRAEAVIRDQEIQLRQITDTAPIMLTRCSRDLHYQFVNRAYAEMLGLAAEEIIGKPIVEIMGADGFEAIRPHVEIVLQGEPAEYEQVVPFARIGPRFLRVAYSPEMDEQAGVRGWVASISDITERKRVEAALQESEARFTQMADSAPVLIWLMGTDKLCTYFNRPWLEFTGRALEQELGNGWAENVHPDDLPLCLKTYLEAFDARREFRMEYRLRRHDGEYRWVLQHGVPRFAVDQLFLGYIGSGIDLNDRKAIEDSLRRSEARLATFAAATFEGIVEIEAGRILDCNEQFARMIGGSVAELRGVEVGSLIAPADLDRVLANVLEGPEQVVELNMIRRDGTRIFVEAHGRPVFPGSSRRHAAVRDVTARKQAEDALQEAHDALERRVQERTKELNLANAALRGEKSFSDSLIELAPAVIALVDGQGNLIRTNAYAEQLTGYPFAKAQGRNMIKMFVPKPEQPRVRHLLREALEGRLTHELVAPLRTRDRRIRHIEWFTKPIPDADGKPSAVLAIGQDITLRLQAVASIRRSEHHLANFFDQAPIGLAWLSAGGTILRANQAQLDFMRCSAQDYLGHSFLEFCHEPEQGRELLARLAAKETLRNLRMTQRRRDGSNVPVLVDANSLWNGDRFEYSSIFSRDISDRVKLEQEILHVSEREHRRIAQDLHDGLGQLLAGAAYLAGTARQDLAAKSLPEARQLRRIWEVINEALAMSRNLARGLHPVEPEPNGLMAALESLTSRTQKLFHICCRFNARRPVLVRDNTVATHLFRIAQEAVTNAIKHGRPGRINISLTETPGHLILAVKDNGSGLPAHPRKNAGMGLRIMRYRAGMIGGSLLFQKKVGGGTTVVCTVHLPDQSVRKHAPKAGRRRRNKADRLDLSRPKRKTNIVAVAPVPLQGVSQTRAPVRKPKTERKKQRKD